MADSAMNVFNNAILPFDIRRYDLVVGSAQLVAVEVIVSKILRKIVGVGGRGFAELAAIHAVSLPFLGGLSGFFEANQALPGTQTRALQDGAKGIPAVLLAQYITNVAAKGLHIPKVTFKEILVTAASKTLSRPLIVLMYPKLHKALQGGFRSVNRMEQLQNANSNLKM
jgi:hypothetical protein